MLVQALPLVAPLILSKDVYAYWGAARVVTVHEANPYRAFPADFPRDPALPFVSEQWRASAPPYGPLWVTAATLPAVAAGTSAHRAELGYRLLALLGVLFTVGLIAARTRNAAAVAFLGWNPLIAIHFAGGGHNDAWMAALMALAVLTRGTARAGAAWPLAAAIKAVPLVLLPLELARTRFRLPRRFSISLVCTGAVIIIVSTAVFGTGWVSASLATAHASSTLGAGHWLMRAGLSHRSAVIIGGLAFLTVYAALMVEAWRNGRARLSLAASVLSLSSSALRPWYALWSVALAAAEEDKVAAIVAYGVTVYLLLADAVQL